MTDPQTPAPTLNTAKYRQPKQDLTSLPCYRGKVTAGTTTNHPRYCYVGRDTLAHVSGPVIESPSYDLIVWLDKNPKLVQPVANETWLTFRLKATPANRFGWRVLEAEAEN